MSKLVRVAGFVWAAPVTLFGLAYVALFFVLGWYRWVGLFGDALVWSPVPDKAPAWLNSAWAHWGGHTVGNVVVVKFDVGSDRGKVVLRHEQEHVHQFMVLGAFQLVFYAAFYVAIKLACPNSDAYYSNPFEVDARRAAGQVVDVEGTLRKLVAARRKGEAQHPTGPS